MGKDIHGLSQESMDLLEAYDWPGNIRELENVIERAVALEKSQTILPESLPEHIVRRVPKGPAAAGLLPESGFNLEEHVEGLERNTSRRRWSRAGGVQVRAAELLGHDLPVVPLLRQEIQFEMMRLPARGDRPMAFALLALSLVYLWLFVARGWIPHDEGMLGQSAERVLAGGLPHIDYEEPYTGGLTWMHAAVFKLAGIDLLYLRWLLFAGAVARASAHLPHPQALSGACGCRHWRMGGARLEFPQLLCGATVVVAARLRALACTWSFVRYVETGRPIDAAAAGLAAGLSILIKQTGLYVLMALVMALVYAPGGEHQPHQPSRARVPAVAVAVGGIVLAFWILRARLSISDLLYLLLPIGACCRLLFSTGDSSAQTGSQNLLRGLVPALAGAAVPLVCFVAPYVLDGQVGALIYGAFVLPQRRVQFASFDMPPAHWIFAGLPLLWAVAPVPPPARWPLRGWWPSAIVLSLAAALWPCVASTVHRSTN